MRPSEKSFDQVRNILGKLDRSIDEIRQKRTQPYTPAPPPPVPSGSNGNGNPPGVAATASPPTRTSQFGRATPLRPS